MEECIRLEYDVDGNNFSSAGNASESVKRTLKQLGVDAASVRRVAIAMYEGEINMVIHAHGGKAIAGVTFDAQYQGTLTDRIEEMVREKITAKDAGITEVAVTADPTLCTEIRTLSAETAGKAMTAEQIKKFDELFGKISPAGSESPAAS